MADILISTLRVVVAGALLGVLVGRLVAQRPYHVTRLLPRHWLKRVREMGRERWVRLVAVGLGVTAMSLVLTTLISIGFAQANIQTQNPAENPLVQLQVEFPLLLLVLVNLLPIFEEWVFRGILVDEILRWKGSKLLAVVLSSAVFAAFHLSNPGTYPAFALTLFPSSLLLGVCYLKVGLGGAILAHNSYNSFLVIVSMLA